MTKGGEGKGGQVRQRKEKETEKEREGRKEGRRAGGREMELSSYLCDGLRICVDDGNLFLQVFFRLR